MACNVVGDVAVDRLGHYVIKTSTSRPSPRPPEGAVASVRDRAPWLEVFGSFRMPVRIRQQGFGERLLLAYGGYLGAVAVRNHGSRDPSVGYRAGPVSFWAPLRVPALRAGRAQAVKRPPTRTGSPCCGRLPVLGQLPPTSTVAPTGIAGPGRSNAARTDSVVSAVWSPGASSGHPPPAVAASAVGVGSLRRGSMDPESA